MPDYISAAAEAAPAFGLAPERIEILSHSENVVCELTMGHGDRRVMRLHRHGYNTLAELESEVRWVAALGDAGIPVPVAVPTTNGGYYTTVEIDGQSIHVGVVEWVTGSPLGSPTQAGGPDIVPHYRRIGELAAHIRAHTAIWVPPEGFVRRRWDADALVGEAPLWGRFWEVDALTESQRQLFTAARTMLVDELGSLPTTGDEFGLIHSDLHLGNLMADGDDLTVIDFDDAGFGWFVHELAVALHPVLDEPWFDEARSALVAGYRAVHPLTATEESQIDLFLTMRSLMIVGWLDARKEVPIYSQFGAIAAQAEAVTERYVASHYS